MSDQLIPASHCPIALWGSAAAASPAAAPLREAHRVQCGAIRACTGQLIRTKWADSRADACRGAQRA
eukprot:gene15875-biopygen21747